jgi:PAS domain S-box-containing protein
MDLSGGLVVLQGLEGGAGAGVLLSLPQLSAELELVYSNAPIGLCVIDTQFRWVRINRALAEINGIAPEEHIGRSVGELLPEVAPQVMRQLQRVIETGEPLRNIEIRGTTPAQPGVVRTWIQHYHPLRDEAGRVVAVNAVCEEVTEKLKAREELRERERSLWERERSLRESQARLAMAQRAGRTGVFDSDLLTGRSYWTPELEALHGLEPGRYDGSQEMWAGLVHPGDLARVRAEVREALAGRRQSLEQDYRIARGGRDEAWVARSALITYDTAGTPVRMVGTLVDITDRKRVEQALRNEEERFRLAASAMQGIVYDLDLEANSVMRSSGLKAILGYDEDEMGSGAEGWWELIHPVDRQPNREEFERLVARGERFLRFEYRVRHREGHWVYVSDHASVLFGESGKPRRMVGCTVSVDEHRRANEALQRATEDLRATNEELASTNARLNDANGRLNEANARLNGANSELNAINQRLNTVNDELSAANAAKDRFLAVLSHELRTPLTPVLMSIESVEGRGDIPADVHGLLEMVRRNIALETRLIDDLLDLSRVSTGKLRLEATPVHLHEVVKHAVAMVEPELEAKGITYSLDLRARDLITGDEARLQQVLWNLLKNAAKFTPVGGSIEIQTRDMAEGAGPLAGATPGTDAGRRAAGMLELKVRDSGIGIPAQAMERIFDAFEQADPAVTRQFGGLGLGLAITKALVDLHGGEIGASSGGTNQGSTFTVRLPARLPAAPPSPDLVINAGAEASGSMRLLVVEDHPDTARMLSLLLRKAGHQVETAQSAAAALLVAASKAFDLVISDVGLPDATGHELMRELSSRYGLTGIALSGYGMEDDLQRSRDAGFAEHLTKPVSANVIREAVSRLGRTIPGRGCRNEAEVTDGPGAAR